MNIFFFLNPQSGIDTKWFLQYSTPDTSSLQLFVIKKKECVLLARLSPTTAHAKSESSSTNNSTTPQASLSSFHNMRDSP